jgi:hypothetical protein
MDTSLIFHQKSLLRSEGLLVGRPPFVWAFVPTWIAFNTQKNYLGPPPSIFTLRTVAPNNIAPKNTIASHPLEMCVNEKWILHRAFLVTMTEKIKKSCNRIVTTVQQ